jgi:hypothetical protein
MEIWNLEDKVALGFMGTTPGIDVILVRMQFSESGKLRGSQRCDGDFGGCAQKQREWHYFLSVLSVGAA